MTRTRVLTLVLVLLVGGAVGFWIWPWAGPTTGLTRTAAERGGRGAQTGTHDEVTDIRMELLQRERAALSEPDRNPFRFERRRRAGQCRSRWSRPDRRRLRRYHRFHSGSSGTFSRPMFPAAWQFSATAVATCSMGKKAT